MNGRCLLANEMPHHAKHYNITRATSRKERLRFYYVQKRSALTLDGEQLICHRCGMHFPKQEGKLAIEAYYCPYCVSYGRVTTRDDIYVMPWHGLTQYYEQPLCWKGTLSSYQQKISDELIHHIDKERELLVYAVTGAGKTEMLFYFLETLIMKQKHIAYVAPRIDVILEVAHRIQQVFPNIPIPIIYGKQHDYILSPLVACTIPQLIRFEKCFDVIIIDEVDAFPYYRNAFLENLVQKALACNGQLVYLSATLTKELEEKRHHIPCFTLPVRYHLKPLPVPTILWSRASQKWIYKKHVPYQLKKLMSKRERAVLIFIPSIARLKQLYHKMKQWFPNLSMDYVYSQDEKREEKVRAMRDGRYDVLLTTTILERGVTFDNIDVWILEAHHRSYTRQVLVQISGRVGRKAQYSEGKIYWLSEGWSVEMKKAYHLILQMNEERKRWLS